MRILFPLDGSTIAEAALRHSRALGDAFGAELVLLHVLATEPAVQGPATNLLERQLRRRRAEEYLARIGRRLAALGLKVTAAVEEGRTTEEILRYAVDRAVDLVVLTESGQGDSGPGRLGGTAGKIIAGSGVSVMLVPEAASRAEAREEDYKLVLAPVDGSPGSGWAARVAAAIAMASKATLLLARVVRTTGLPGSAGYSRETRRLAERVTQAARLEAGHWLRLLRSQLPAALEVETLVVVAPGVCKVIREITEARHPDLLVVSAHGFEHEPECRYGPVAERLLLHTTCPTLVLQHAATAAADTSLSEDSGRWRVQLPA